jgi:hypothetical protein
MTKTMMAQILAQPHRANAAHPETAHCASWLSAEQLEQAHARHVAAGRKLDGTVECPCGNHERRMYV